MRFVSYLLPVAILPLLNAAAIAWGGAWLLLPPLLLFVTVPTLDHLLPLDTANPDDSQPPWPLPWRTLVRLWVPAQLALLAWGLHTVASGRLAGWESVALVADLGLMTGAIGITFAHELMHRTAAVDRALGEVLMASVGYTWFCVEHVHGHHKHVATPRDPATARAGETVYGFVPRSVLGGLRSAVVIEVERCRRRGLSWLDPRHRVTRYGVCLAALAVGLTAALGPLGLAAWLAQGAVAVGLLEVINYVEHYGLVRHAVGSRDGAPVFERVQPRHSWNSAHAMSNRFLANLARHADHHAYASRPWELLRHWDDAPQLPSGYGGMLLLALVSPLWFRVMDRRVAALPQRATAGEGEPAAG